MKYRVGLPFWRQIYKLTDCTLYYRYSIYKSRECGDFLADSKDVTGLFVECSTIDEILELTPQLARELIEDSLKPKKPLTLIPISPIKVL